MRVLREDFKQGTTTDSPLGAAATTINSDEFVDLRAVTGGSLDVAKLILDPSGINGDPEIVYVTAHTAAASAVTVSRGREGTTAREHPSGTTWKHGPTSQDFGLQIGEMKQYLGDTAPERWVFARGQALSRTTYAKLFDIIGETFGAGDGSTTFNVPDLQGKFPVGASTSTGDYDLGDIGGKETHVLTTAQLPSHTHAGPSHTHAGPSHSHSFSATTGSDNHSHTAQSNGSHVHSGRWNAAFPKTDQPFVAAYHAVDAGSTSSTGKNSAGAHTHSTTSDSHSHSVSGTSGSSGTGNTGASGTGATSSVGSGTAHENRPPFVAVNYIIYAGA